MAENLMQFGFEIEGLIPSELKILEKIWLKEGKLFVEKKEKKLIAYLLEDSTNGFQRDQIILPYLKISSLISNNTPTIISLGGSSIQSKNEFGKELPTLLVGNISTHWPDEAIKQAEEHAPDFLKQIINIHDKYNEVIKKNKFLQIAIDYFYDSNIKFVYNNEGFISAMISLEALFNEASNDIKYKLSQRAGLLLGLIDFDSMEVIESLKNFYNYRSKLVHGQGAPAYDPDRYKISLYTRNAIIIFCILMKNPERVKINKNDRKKELLREIDYAMINISRRESLQNEIHKSLKDFDLKVPRTFEGKGNNKFKITAW